MDVVPQPRPAEAGIERSVLEVEGSKNRWLMRLARDFRFLAI